MKKLIAPALMLSSSLMLAPIVNAVDQPSPSMCDSAVDQAKVVLEMMRGTVERNMGNGSLSSAEYEQAKSSLDRMDPLLTQSKCMASSGVDLEIYECLSLNKGNLLGCTAKYAS